jgi:hypothetical protein
MISAAKHLKDGNLVRPELLIPNQRRLLGGKNLDGGMWFEFEGIEGRLNMSPQQAFDMAVNILKTIGVDMEFDAPPTLGPGSNFAK